MKDDEICVEQMEPEGGGWGVLGVRGELQFSMSVSGKVSLRKCHLGRDINRR